MVGPGTIPSVIGIIGTALLIPMIFLLVRGGGDPEGVVDGLVRLCWLMPLLWLCGLLIEVRTRGNSLQRVLRLHAPLFVPLALLFFLMLGLRNDGAEIVFRPGPEARAEALRRSQEEDGFVQRRLPLMGGLGRWAHETLPPHPLPF